MDTSRRAVEAYRRSRMIDGVTSDEDKVAPVYKLEEVCELLRTSHVGIVKEVSGHILKRLDHRSPVVKQKALRLIKFAVGKSGVEFRREIQRHSVAVRQLTHYRGHPDPLKGDALNKAVRETANETVAVIFASEESKEAATEGAGTRIEGFGNTNFSTPVEEKKSFLSEVVDLGKASILQGINNFAASHSVGNDDNGNYGSYRSPNLRRSLTSETDRWDRYERNSGSSSFTGGGNSSGSVTWGQDSVQRSATDVNPEDGPSVTAGKTREERLLETIVTPGGVRLQPTRDAIRVFLAEASKLNPLAMCRALESKLQSNLWQVRTKAICILDSILRKNDDEQLSVISSYFGEHKDSVVKCAQSPQASLREKASKVLSLLEKYSGISAPTGEENSTLKDIPSQTPLPDLIDTGDPGDYGDEESGSKHAENLSETKSAELLIDDLFGNESTATRTHSSQAEENPFADVSFHVSEDKNNVNNLFSGMSIADKSAAEIKEDPIHQTSNLTDIFSSHVDQHAQKEYVPDLLADLSVDEVPVPNKNAGGDILNFIPANSPPSFPVSSKETLIGNVSAHMAGMNPNIFVNPVQQLPPNVMPNMAFTSQTVNYGEMNNFTSQQQFQFQNFGNFPTGFSHPSINAIDGNHLSALPDIFRPTNNPVQSYGSNLSSSKETKAFDFISDHVSSVRGAKKIT